MGSQKWLSVSFNIDILSGPWSIGHMFSQEMVRLSNLDRARAIGMVQSGTLCHDVSFVFLHWLSVWTNQRLPGWWSGTEIPGMSKIVPRMVVPEKQPTETDNRISGMAARRRFVTANGIRANVQNPRLSDQTIIIRLHEHEFGSRRPMKVPQRTDSHELAIAHLRDQLGRAVYSCVLTCTHTHMHSPTLALTCTHTHLALTCTRTHLHLHSHCAHLH